jgi:copper(I)-binding protein
MTRLALTVSFVVLAAVGSAEAEPVTATAAWIRATPPGARTAAAYLTLTNAGPADRLLGATTPAARAVEVHTHVLEGGMQRMLPLADLPVPAGAAVTLEPGGLHLMLVDLTAPLEAGARVVLSLRFAVSGALELEVPVVDARARPPPEHPSR